MRKTEKAHWINGHQLRGKWFHTLNMSLFNVGFMVAWGYNNKQIHTSFNLFKLV